ncbi:MAG: hypothetical protein EKK64_00890 [Neisseriaceae bacterium]|nr:MAG: hypothetical protein EKK64_00890 [Neisseriaceae bacterium]
MYSKIIKFEKMYNCCILVNSSFYKDKNPYRGNDLPFCKVFLYEKGNFILKSQLWCLNGHIDREGDKPARVDVDRSVWYRFGKIHRDNDFPAVVHTNGSKEWFYHGLRHREGDLPAAELKAPHVGVTTTDVLQSRITNSQLITKIWFLYGKQHRGNDLPAFVGRDGSQEWWVYGQKHREHDLPAVIEKDYTAWWVNGKRHRKNGPAEISIYGNFISCDYSEIWFKNNHYSRDDGPAKLSIKKMFGIPISACKEFISCKKVNSLKTEYCLVKNSILGFIGSESYHKDGLMHRDNNLPAAKFKLFGITIFREFFENDKKFTFKRIKNEFFKFFKKTNELLLHSYEDRPSRTYSNGTKEWHWDNEFHRECDQPAVVYPNGDKEWWYHGKRHREYGPALIIGNKQYWYKNGEFERFYEVKN